MDADRFDEFTKRLATAGASRRRLLRGLGGGLLAALGGAGAGAAPACRGAGHPCAGNQQCCDGLVCAASGPGAARRCTPPTTTTTTTTAAPTTTTTTTTPTSTTTSTTTPAPTTTTTTTAAPTTTTTTTTAAPCMKGGANAPCRTGGDCCSGFCTNFGCCPVCPSGCSCYITTEANLVCTNHGGSRQHCTVSSQCPTGEFCILQLCQTLCPSAT